MGHQDTGATIVFAIDATVHGEVSAGGNGDGVFDEANSPVRVVCKAAPEAFSIGFDANG